LTRTVRSDDPKLPPLDRIRNLIRAQYRIQASNQDFLKTLIIGNSLDIEVESQAGRDFLCTVLRGAISISVASVLQDAMNRGGGSLDRFKICRLHAWRRMITGLRCAGRFAQAGVHTARVRG